MRQAMSYRAARRNIVRAAGQPAKGQKGFWWGLDWAVRANAHAKLDERRKTCADARMFAAKALAEQDILFKTGRAEIVKLKALQQFWRKAPCAPRTRRRLLRQLDLDLRSARA